jgi:hypothetical protein
MDIMHACDFIPFQWPRKEKSSKRLIYPNTLSHISPQNIHHTYLHRKNATPIGIRSICAMSLHSKLYFFFIVQFKAHEIVAVYGGVHLCKLHVCNFISWG